MRERLLVHLRSLPQIVEGWNRLEESDSQPSQFARSLTKVTKNRNCLQLQIKIEIAFFVCPFPVVYVLFPCMLGMPNCLLS